MKLAEKINQLFPQMIQWRRYLHQHPELSYQESQTAAFVAGHLQQLGLQVQADVGGHGVIGLLVGDLPGPTVALRADMDALPIQDEKTNEYASQVPGVMHACGHDAHTSTLLGLAYIFSEMRSTLAGSIKFIFQPAEEVSPGGALPLIQNGVLDDVDVIFGVHLWTPFPVGKVYSKAGPFMAAADEFSVEIQGKGGHGGLPHETIDSVMIGAQLVTSLQTIVSRNVNPTEPAVVSVGSIHAGKSFNVIAERCSLLGTVRTFNSEVRDQIQKRMKDMSHSICEAYGASCEFDYKVGYPPVSNHAKEAERFFKVGKEIFGSEATLESPLIMAGEDFAYYLQKVPGIFMFVGAGNADKGVWAPHHHPSFDIDEESMRNAALLLAGMALDYFESNDF
ncbi:amidohydrolase [Paenibacillus psychroresistens]|uniref:Amidohydrolase n=1 Tax=Paenibacillus psychroresistens TaxID=1778678 RepID=A0A6B8RKM2_9BACL|nr:M20 family metallopeptidase [Paenibacillus psychroresistens]QGQ96961.1 amidohydrolase [Paenibacillus psychroresistens]